MMDSPLTGNGTAFIVRGILLYKMILHNLTGRMYVAIAIHG